jgi:spermidine synthase
MSRPKLPEDPDIALVETGTGEVTLAINGGQAMQAWERELMSEAADLLCSYGSEFLEVGLGLGISALRIASNPSTRRHLVVEKYPRVTELFYQHHPQPPEALEIVHADIFEFAHTLAPASFDGIFFDPALPEPLWDDQVLWDAFVPVLVRALRPGGAFIPFFSTIPVLRKQYVGFFDRVIVERRPFVAYPTTHYTSATSGDAYIQRFIRTR